MIFIVRIKKQNPGFYKIYKKKDYQELKLDKKESNNFMVVKIQAVNLINSSKKHGDSIVETKM